MKGSQLHLTSARTIKFFPATEIAEKTIDSPQKSSFFTPYWLKKIKKTIYGEKIPWQPDGQSNLTAKMCQPFLDSFLSGYMITLPSDVYIHKNPEYNNKIMWEVTYDVAGTHSLDQISGMEIPVGFEKNLYKWNNFWTIVPPKGYSLLFTHPLNRFDLPFFSLSAVVDADKYNFLPVNIPFFIKEDFEGIISAGTPIAQVIPIKREKWNSSVEKLQDNISGYNFLKKSLDRSYKKRFWEKKQY